MSRQFYNQLSGSKIKHSKKGASLLIACLLVFSGFLVFQFSPVSAAVSSGSHLVTHQPVPLTQSLTLRRGYYNYYEADSFSNDTSVSYNVMSSAPISTAVMTATQLNDFANNLSDPVSNSITYQNGTSVQNTVPIPPGQYFLVFYSYYSRANIQYGYVVTPNTPLSYGAIQGPLASGIASFGIANNSGVVTSYEIKTNEIVGVANISSMQVYTRDASQYGVTVTGATLQLNAELVINDNNAGAKVYWVQNVPDFETGPSQVSFGDEIWNWTDLAGYLSNQTVTSTNLNNGGAVYPAGQGNGGPYVYNYNGNNDTYTLPLNFALLMKETILPKTGVLVQVGYMLTANGTAISPKTNWFDNVTIVDPAVQTAYFDVSGNSTTPIGLFYNAELVFGGEGNGATAHFTQLGASLGLFYQNSASPTGILSSFPTYYGFSGDTGESADDLVVTYSNGIASIGTGVNPNYSYLGSASLSMNLQSSTTTSSTTTTSSSTSSVSSTSSTTTASSSTTSSKTTSTTPSSTTTTTSTSQTTTTISSSSPALSQTASSSSSSSSTTTAVLTGTSSSSGSTTTSSGTTSSSTTSSTSSANSSTTKTSGEMPAWEWTAVGVVAGVIIASLAFMALRRKPLPS
ncbi:MAG: thermopsin family protease [Nitrososphaerales archaeon]